MSLRVSEHKPEALKSKLINWLRLAVENGYGWRYYGDNDSRVARTIGTDGADYALGNEDLWSDTTKNIFEDYKASFGQQLSPQLRVDAYGAAADSVTVDLMESSYKLAVSSVPDGADIVASEQFRNWYLDVYLGEILGYPPESIDKLRTAIGKGVPLKTFQNSFNDPAHYKAPLGRPNSPLPASMIEAPPGSEAQIAYVYGRASLLNAANIEFEGESGTIEEYAKEKIDEDSGLPKALIEKRYLLGRSSYKAQIVEQWQKGGDLTSRGLQGFNSAANDATKNVRQKVDPQYMIPDGAFQRVLEYNIGFIDNIGEDEWVHFNGITNSTPLPFPIFDGTKWYERTHEEPWREEFYNTINITIECDGVVTSPYTTLVPRELQLERVSNLLTDESRWLKLYTGEQVWWLDSTKPSAPPRESFMELLAPEGGAIFSRKFRTQVKENITNSLAGPRDAKETPLGEFLGGGPREWLSIAGGVPDDFLDEVRKSAVSHILKNLDKMGGPTDRGWSNPKVLELIANHAFVTNWHQEKGGNLFLTVTIHRSYFDVLPRNTNQMSKYEVAFGDGSYYGGYYEHHLRFNGSFGKSFEKFKTAMKSFQDKLEEEKKTAIISDESFAISGEPSGPQLSQFGSFKEFLNVHEGPGNNFAGTVTTFLDINSSPGYSVKPHELAELVFICDSAYSLKGIYAIVNGQKRPLRIGFGAFRNDLAVSKQNILYLINMEQIVEADLAKKSIGDFLRDFVISPPTLTPTSTEKGKLHDSVKTLQQLNEENNYLSDVKIQEMVAEATEKRAHWSGSPTFVFLEQTTSKIQSISDAYEHFLAKYGVTEVAKQIMQCIIELIGIDWSCEARLEAAFNYLGVEEFRKNVLLPYFEIAGWGADALAKSTASTYAQAEAALEPVRQRRRETYYGSLAKIDSSYMFMSAEDLEKAFESAAGAKQGLAELDAQTTKRASFVDFSEDAALFIEELGEKFELESICENLASYLSQLMDIVTDIGFNDLSFSITMPNPPKIGLPTIKPIATGALLDAIGEAMKEALQEAIEKATAGLVRALLKTILRICQDLRNAVKAGKQVGDTPKVPISAADLQGLLDGLFGPDGNSGKGALPKFKAPFELSVSSDNTAAQLQLFLDEITSKMLPSTLCNLLNGVASSATLKSTLKSARRHPELRDVFLDADTTRQVFLRLGSLVSPGFCASLLSFNEDIIDDTCDIPPPSDNLGQRNQKDYQDLKQDLDAQLQQYLKLASGDQSQIMDNLIEPPCNPPPSDPASATPPKPPVVNWKAIPVVEASNNTAINVFYANIKQRFASNIPSSYKNTIKLSNKPTVREAELTEKDLSRVVEIDTALSDTFGIDPGTNAHFIAEKIAISEILTAIKSSPGFVRFISPVFPLAQADIVNGVHPSIGHWRKRYLNSHYLGTDDTNLPQIPDVAFLGGLPNVAPYAENTFKGFKIEYENDLPGPTPPLSEVMHQIENAAVVAPATIGTLDGQIPNHRHNQWNSRQITRIPERAQTLLYPATEVVDKLSKQFKQFAYNNISEVKFNKEPNSKLEFKMNLSQVLTDKIDTGANDRDEFRAFYNNSTEVTQPAAAEDPSLTNVEQYDVNYYDIVENGTDPELKPPGEEKSEMFLKKIDRYFQLHADVSLADDVDKFKFKKAYMMQCLLYTAEVIDTAPNGPIQTADDLTNIEFTPSRQDRTWRANGFIERPPLDGAPVAPGKPIDFMEIPPSVPHGDLTSMRALKKLVKDAFQETPVCDPAGSPLEDKNIPQLAKAALLGVIYLYMRTYTLQFFMKIYPFSVQYSLLDICRSNLVPLHIAQKFKADLSQDAGFYCDFMEIAGSIMRERKIRNDELVSRDPITGRPIEMNSQDDMLVFFIKEQIASLNEEFEYIIEDHLKEMEGLNLLTPEKQRAWERVRRDKKKKPLDFFLLDPDTLDCASSYAFYTDSSSGEKYEGFNGGKFYFEKYIRVIDKSPDQMPQSVITDLLRARRPEMVPEDWLREISNSFQDAPHEDQVRNFLETPDLVNVVNIEDWSAFWDDAREQEGISDLLLTNKPSDFFESVSLGVRLVYVLPYSQFPGDPALPPVDDPDNILGVDGHSIFADPETLVSVMNPEFSRNEKAGRLLQVTHTVPPMTRQIISLPLMEREFDLIASGDSWSRVAARSNNHLAAQNTRIVDLRSELENEPEFKFLFDYIFPTDRLFADAFVNVNLNVSQNYRETNNSYTAVKRALRNLFYVLINDDPINKCKEYEDADIMASLMGLDWGSIMEDMGIDIIQITFDFFASILMAAVNILGSAIDPFGLLKLVLCPLIPTEGEFGGFGRTIKKEWDCLTLPPFPQLPSSDSPTACKTGGLSPECLNVPQYTIIKGPDGNQLLEIPEEFKPGLGPNDPVITYTTKEALDTAKETRQDAERAATRIALDASDNKSEQSPLSAWAFSASPPAEPDDS
jgi:hypothetical protein